MFLGVVLFFGFLPPSLGAALAFGVGTPSPQPVHLGAVAIVMALMLSMTIGGVFMCRGLLAYLRGWRGPVVEAGIVMGAATTFSALVAIGAAWLQVLDMVIAAVGLAVVALFARGMLLNLEDVSCE